jgi:hypothetical protein
MPIPPGVAWDSGKSARFATTTQHPVSGARPVSFSVSPYPSWEWELNWEKIRDQGLDPSNANNVAASLSPDFFALQDFYLAMNGSNGRFIYDPAANNSAFTSGGEAVPLEDTYVTAVTAGTLVNGYSGLTDGINTQYQLYRTSRITGADLPVEAIDAISSLSTPVTGAVPFKLFLNGTLVPSANYTLNQYPCSVTFGVAPAGGQALCWQGYFAYVAKFLDDRMDLRQFMKNLWELQSLKLEQVPLGF